MESASLIAQELADNATAGAYSERELLAALVSAVGSIPVHVPGWMLTVAGHGADPDGNPWVWTEPVIYFAGGLPHTSMETYAGSDDIAGRHPKLLWHPDQHLDGQAMTLQRAEAQVLAQARRQAGAA